MLGSGQAHLIADLRVTGDRLASRASRRRDGIGEQLSSGQAHLVAGCPVAGDGRELFGGGLGVVFGELLGRADADLVVFVHGDVGFL